jgi:hypothetical protein
VIDPSTRRPRAGWILCGILAAGAVLRLYSYIANPSFSVDDAMLTVNVASRSFLGLLHPLALEQTAAPLFLWLLKLSSLIAGIREPALRAVPLLAGLALPYFMWRLASRVVGTGPALVAGAFAALSPILVQYSVSAKPYVLDALVTVWLIDLTLGAIDHPRHFGAWAALTVGGVLGILLSSPSVFVLAGCGAGLLASSAVRSSDGWMTRAGIAGAVWVGTFVLVYLGITRAEAGSAYMQAFWDAKILDLGSYLRPVHAWDILARVTVQPFVPDRPMDWFPPVTWLATIWGLWALRSDRARLACVAGPLLALLAASAVHRYPIAPRVCVFAAPIFFLIYAKTLDDILQRWPRPRVRLIAAVVVALWVVTLGVLSLNTRFWAPPTRQLVAAFRARAQPHDPVYLFAGIVPFWLVYATDWSHPDTAFLNAAIATQSAAGNAFHNAASRGHAVADTEGAGLAFTTGGRVELIGLAPGIQWREGHGFSQPFPDANWGEREAARMRAAASPAIWVALSHLYSGERGALTRALELAGGRRDSVWEKGDAVLQRYRFGGGP